MKGMPMSFPALNSIIG